MSRDTLGHVGHGRRGRIQGADGYAARSQAVSSQRGRALWGLLSQGLSGAVGAPAMTEDSVSSGSGRVLVLCLEGHPIANLGPV